MFESVGFFELVVIFGVALVVLGPKRLPGLVGKIGRWVGKARSMARQFREQLENEVNLEELNRMTEARTKPAPKYPAPPPEFGGEPLQTTPAAENSAAPVQDSAEVPATPNTPAASDDTYSHAHAAGDAPLPYVPEAAEFTPAAEHAPAAPQEPATTSDPHERSV